MKQFVGLILLCSALLCAALLAPEAQANQRPVAVPKIQIYNQPFATRIAVMEGYPVTINAQANDSYDPDGWTTPGLGMSDGAGECAWNVRLTENHSAPTFDKVIDNPKDPRACNTQLGTFTFRKQSGVNQNLFNILRLRDAYGEFTASHGKVVIDVVDFEQNRAPVAAVKLANITDNPYGTPATDEITVIQGKKTNIRIDTTGSDDPNGWKTKDLSVYPYLGIWPGGKCEVNINFDQQAEPTYELKRENPTGHLSCNYISYNNIFNQAPGTYTIKVLKITDAQGLVSNIATARIKVVAPAATNNNPIAVAQVRADNGAFGSEIAVTRGVPVRVRLGAGTSSDPNGWTTALTGVSQGGKCEWNSDLNQGTTTYERTIANPGTPSACDIDLGNITFNDAPGRYIYPVLRITDAAKGVSNVASITVVVNEQGVNLAPVAVAKFSVNGGPPQSHIYVSRGVPVRIELDAASSSDPNGWTTPRNGVSQGGKCEWNTNLDQSRPTPFIRTIANPTSPAACNVSLGTLTFNDPPGTYTYVLLRIQDAGGLRSAVAYLEEKTHFAFSHFIPIVSAQSADGSAIVTVVDGATPTPTLTATPTATPTSSCDPFGYNNNCPTPTGTPSTSPSATPSTTLDPSHTVEPTVDPSFSPTPTPTNNPNNPVGEVLQKVVDGFISGVATLLGLDGGQITRALRERANSITATLGTLAALLTAPLAAASIAPQFAQISRFFGSFFFTRRKGERWGIVVDSDLGNPIAGAVVQLFDAKFNQLKETEVTGADGQFGFLLPPGKYYIVVSETGFTFPARKTPPTTLQENERIYLGEEFTITEQNQDSIPHIVVPLDRETKVSAARALFARYVENILAFVDRVGLAFLFIGALTNTYLLLAYPGKLNFWFEVLYLVLFILKLYIMLFHQKGIGSVTDKGTGKQLDLAIVRLYDSTTNRIIQTRVTNKNGRFFLLVPRGSYTISVSKPGYETLTMKDVVIKGRASKAIALDIQLQSAPQ